MAVTAKVDKANWKELDPSSLSKAQAAAYQAYRDAYAASKKAREAFEATVQPDAPKGQHFVFGYNFGKLSVAIVAGQFVPRADGGGSKGPVTLASLSGKPVAQAQTELRKARSNGAASPAEPPQAA